MALVVFLGIETVLSSFEGFQRQSLDSFPSDSHDAYTCLVKLPSLDPHQVPMIIPLTL